MVHSHDGADSISRVGASPAGNRTERRDGNTGHAGPASVVTLMRAALEKSQGGNDPDSLLVKKCCSMLEAANGKQQGTSLGMFDANQRC